MDCVRVIFSNIAKSFLDGIIFTGAMFFDSDDDWKSAPAERARFNAKQYIQIDNTNLPAKVVAGRLRRF